MKKVQLVFLTLLAVTLPAHSQLLLQQNQPWTYEFSTLPQTGFVPAIGRNPSGSFAFSIRPSSWDVGDRLFYEMFENNTSEAPLVSGSLDFAPPYAASAQRDFAWQDKQGIIRLSMIQGSVIVDELSLQAIVSGPSMSQYDVCSATVVPEPGTWSLILLALAGCVCIRVPVVRKTLRSRWLF